MQSISESLAISVITGMLAHATFQHITISKSVCRGKKCFVAQILVTVTNRKSVLQSWDDGKQGPIDPFAIAEPEIDSISERLRQSLLTDIPALGKAAEYFFQVYYHSLDKSLSNST